MSKGQAKPLISEPGELVVGTGTQGVCLLGPVVMLDYTKSLEPWTCVSCCSWVVADAVSAVLEGSAEELQAWKKTLLKACVQWLVASFSGGQQEDGTQDQEKQMLRRFNELLVGISY